VVVVGVVRIHRVVKEETVMMVVQVVAVLDQDVEKLVVLAVVQQLLFTVLQEVQVVITLPLQLLITLAVAVEVVLVK
jgi:hypothetical protein